MLTSSELVWYWQNRQGMADMCRYPCARRITRWVTMQEAVPVTRALQNHLPDLTHLTTLAGVWMPQYLPAPGSAQS